MRLQIETNLRINLEMFGLVKQLPSWRGEEHCHSFWEIIFIKDGSGFFTYSGKNYNIEKGDILILAPNVMHKFVHDEKTSVEHFYIGFSFDFDSSELVPASDIIPVLQNPYSSLFKPKLQTIADAIEKYESENELSAKYGDVMALVSEIINEVFCCKNLKYKKLNRNQVLAGKAMDYIKANLSKNIMTDEIAGMFYLSAHYFADIFKKETGMTLKEFQNLWRMKKAAEILQENEESISDIANNLGFGSIHYFSRKFKGFYGKSPAEYRKGFSSLRK